LFIGIFEDGQKQLWVVNSIGDIFRYNMEQDMFAEYIDKVRKSDEECDIIQISIRQAKYGLGLTKGGTIFSALNMYNPRTKSSTRFDNKTRGEHFIDGGFRAFTIFYR